jgi:hypothetical protein
MGRKIRLTEEQLRNLIASNTENIINEQLTQNQKLGMSQGYGPVSSQYADQLASSGKLKGGTKPTTLPSGVPSMPSLKNTLNPTKSNLGPVGSQQSRMEQMPMRDAKPKTIPNGVPSMPSLRDTLNPPKSTLGPVGKPAQTPGGTVQGKPAQTPGGTVQGKPTQTPKGTVQASPAVGRIPAKPDPKVMELQKQLKAAGYDLGVSGSNKDGVDGVMGRRTREAQRQMIMKKGQDAWKGVEKQGQDLKNRSKKWELNPNTGLPYDTVGAMKDQLPNVDDTNQPSVTTGDQNSGWNNNGPIGGETDYLPDYEMNESIEKIKKNFKRFL